jgi:hypothetical protein
MAQQVFDHKLWRSRATPRSRIRARKNSTDPLIGPRGALNLIEGTGISMTVVEDEPNDEFDVTISSTVTQGVKVRKNSAGTTLGPRARLNLIEGSNVTVTIADDSGNDEVDVTIAASAPAVPISDYARWQGTREHIRSNAVTTVQSYGLAAPTLNGATSNVSDDTGEYVSYLSPALLGGTAGWLAPFSTETRRSRLPITTWVIQTGSDLTSQRVWCCLAAANPGGVDNSVNTIGFRFSTNVPDTTWVCFTEDGATPNAASSGVTVVASTRYELTLDLRVAGVADWYINGTAVRTGISANLPGNSTNLGIYGGYLTNLSGNQRSIANTRQYITSN